MKKVLLLCLTVLLGTAPILLPGCSYFNKDVPPTQEKKSDITQEQPHSYSDFQGPGTEFRGGTAVTDYSLTVVRRVSHPELVRLVFEFTGKEGDTVASPPEYRVRMENEMKISLRLRGVVREEVMKNKSAILSLSELLQDVSFDRESNGEAVVSLSFTRPVTFQVFDLAKPARVVVVLKPDMKQMNKM